MPPQQVKVQEPIRFGEDFELDLTARRLSRGNRVLKVNMIPLGGLALLIERWGETQSRATKSSSESGAKALFSIPTTVSGGRSAKFARS